MRTSDSLKWLASSRPRLFRPSGHARDAFFERNIFNQGPEMFPHFFVGGIGVGDFIVRVEVLDLRLRAHRLRRDIPACMKKKFYN